MVESYPCSEACNSDLFSKSRVRISPAKSKVVFASQVATISKIWQPLSNHVISRGAQPFVK